MKRIVGIIGGMGPEATVDFYREIIRCTPAEKDQDHIPVLIYSNPEVPERTQAILEGGESPLPYILRTAQVLEQAGAGILTMPCNTAHYYFSHIQAGVAIPILNMIEETLRRFRALFPDGSRVGLLATTGTVRSGIYQGVFARDGVEVLVPSLEDQDLIYRAIHQVKAGRQDEQTERMLESFGSALVQEGARAVVLGCTEIPLAFNQNRVLYPVLNATRILAEAAVAWARGEIE
ncbi:MAG: amino acid racemase [Acidobacteriota bacterium]